MVRNGVEEETSRLGLEVKTVDGGGVPLKRSVTTSDLGKGKPCPQSKGPLCLTALERGEGGSTTTGVELFTRETENFACRLI